MCGINGFIQFNRELDRNTMQALVHKMNQQIVHRGPDEEGLFADDICALGMRRLSIIDLENGSQPIWTDDHTAAVIFNGEIYNYRELKAELIAEGVSFYTKSDTEVILKGINKHGKSFISKLEGMFAIAYYDKKQGEWIFARDRIGEKPFYYFCNENVFLFASEVKSLLKTGYVTKEIDREALSQYFQLTYIPAPKSIFKDVKKLMPGTMATLNLSGELTIEQYWSLPKKGQDNYEESYEVYKKQLREALFNSVEHRMISDVPIGAFLSGGFDSSIIVGIMSHISDLPVNTFTIGFNEKEFDESPMAKLVADKNGTNHHVLKLDWNEALKDIDRILENIDEPFADSSLIATYAVSKMTKQYVKVSLTGDSGDELFAGYNKYLASFYGDKYKKIPRVIRKNVVEPAVKLLPTQSFLTQSINKVIKTADLSDFEQRKMLMSLGFKPAELCRLMQDGFVDPMQFLKNEYNYCEAFDLQTKAQYMDLITVLEGDMLVKVDRASMLASLETRVPILDKAVVELAFSIPTRYKIKGRERKIILKDTFRDLLPEELFHAPKHGFGVPINIWIETIFKKQLEKYAEKELLDRQGLFNAAYINQVIKAHMNHTENRYSELWAFYVFQNWYERVVGF